MITGSFWLAASNLPFALAGGLVLAVTLLELLALVIGGSISGLFDGGIDADIDLDVDGHDAHFPILEWVGFGLIPAFALGLVILTLFSLSGYGIQAVSLQWRGALLSPVFAGALALLPTFLLSGPIARFLSRSLFKDETDALSSDELVGGLATITLGATYVGHPTQAKIIDRNRTTHYVLVEPMNPDDRFESGDAVTLVRREGARFLVVGESADSLFETLSSQQITHES